MRFGEDFWRRNLLKVVRREEGTTGYGGHSALILRHPPFAETHLGHSRLVDAYMPVSQKFHWRRPGSQGNVSIGEEKNRKNNHFLNKSSGYDVMDMNESQHSRYMTDK